MIRATIVSLLLVISSNLIAGGGWTHSKGGGFFKLSQNAIIANQIFNQYGDITELDQGINFYSTSLYGEYGFSDRFTGIIYAPFFVRSTINELTLPNGTVVDEGDEMNAVGDFDVTFKYGFAQDKPIVFSASLTLGLPFGETTGGRGKILQSGDGEFNQLIKLEASKSLYPRPFYLSAMVGFNNRTKGFSEEVHASFEAGWTSEKLVAILKFYNLSSLKNGEPVKTQSNGIYSDKLEYFAYGPELLYKFTDQLGVAASAGFAFSGQRILASPNLGVGVFFEL